MYDSERPNVYETTVFAVFSFVELVPVPIIYLGQVLNQTPFPGLKSLESIHFCSHSLHQEICKNIQYIHYRAKKTWKIPNATAKLAPC